MAVTADRVETFGIETRPMLIELSGVRKVYRTGKLEYPARRGVDLAIEDRDMAAIVGPSGSGKSTIMNMITGIDRPTSGSVTVDGQRIDQMGEEELAVWRGRRVGVVFQFFQLLPTLTAIENAMRLPLGYAIARAIIALTSSVAHIDLRFAFPTTNLVVTLIGTIVLPLLVLLAPVRRAVRFKPGEAIRYA